MQDKTVPFQCLSLIICETVLEDTRTRNKSFINTFNLIYCESVPIVYNQLCVVCSITDCKGKLELHITIKEDESNVEMFTVNGSFSSENPLHVTDIVFDLKKIVFNKLGHYSVELTSNGIFIASRRFYLASNESLKKIHIG